MEAEAVTTREVTRMRIIEIQRNLPASFAEVTTKMKCVRMFPEGDYYEETSLFRVPSAIACCPKLPEKVQVPTL